MLWVPVEQDSTMQSPPHSELLLPLTENVPRVVFATVSGAHLYGFESPDSDVDLRGAFVLPEDELIGISRPIETVSSMSLESGIELDWVAHDVAKSVRLITRGSGEVMEQVLSPIVLRTSSWHAELKELTGRCASRRLHYHYRGFLGSRRQLLSRAHPTVKVLLYAYRAALTGLHVLQTGRVNANLPTLLAEYPQDDVEELIERKRSGAEKATLEPHEARQHEAALDRLEDQLDEWRERTALPESVDDDVRLRADLNDFLIRIRRPDTPAPT